MRNSQSTFGLMRKDGNGYMVADKAESSKGVKEARRRKSRWACYSL